jgi:hypothetical protein
MRRNSITAQQVVDAVEADLIDQLVFAGGSATSVLLYLQAHRSEYEAYAAAQLSQRAAPAPASAPTRASSAISFGPRPDYIVPLYDAVSMETALVQDGYPYGRLRTQRRAWMEHKPNKGYRFVTQTKDPKTGRWNKPHAGTYSEFAVLYLDTRDNHVHARGSSPGDYVENIKKFFDLFYDAPIKMIKEYLLYLIARVARLSALIQRNKEGFSGWSVNGVPQPARPGDLEKHEAEKVELINLIEGLKALVKS